MVFEQQSIKGSDQGTTKDYKERQLVVFNLGNEEFGVNINEVNSILKMSPITRIPNAQHYVEGVINLRGQIMVVIDLAKKLGLPQKERDKNTRIIVIETSETMVGMIVDHSREVLRISEEQIQPPPVLITQKVKSEYLEGVAIISKKTEKEKEGTLKDETIQKTEIGGEQLTVQKDSRLLILLDLAKILNSEDVETAQMAQNKDLETELPKEEAQQESKKEEGQQQTAQKEKKEESKEQQQTAQKEKKEEGEKQQKQSENSFENFQKLDS